MDEIDEDYVFPDRYTVEAVRGVATPYGFRYSADEECER